MADHHEVQGLEQGLVDGRRFRVAGDLHHVRQRIAVAAQGETGLLAGFECLLVVNRSEDVVEGRVVALDAVGALDVAGEGQSTEAAEPASPVANVVPQL
ncbi:MAG: hypothetical protein M5U19_07670 [Microthrixaceae bacterium]|nr:hypothetical protein [Microthrixaceae bacterium]